MNLDDKTTNAMSAADLASQAHETVPGKSAKRRKSNGGNGGSGRKAKKPVVETDDAIDNSAPLTMGPANGGERPRKKMLFEAAEPDTPPSIALMGGNGHVALDPSIFAAVEAVAQQDPEPAPAIVKPMAAEARTSVEESMPVAAPVAEPKPAAFAPAESAAPAEPAAPIANMKGSVFQVATLVMKSAEAPAAEPAQAIAPQLEAASAAAPAQEEVVMAEPLIERQPEAAQFELQAPAIVSPPAAQAEEIQPTPTKPMAAPSAQPEVPAADKAPVLSRSQAIAARAARMSAQNSARPAPHTQQPVASTARAPEPQRPADLPVNPGDIYGYWTRVKNGRRFPSRADFDSDQLAEHWPNSMLLTCSKVASNTPATFSSVLRLGANRRSRPGEDLNFTSMITEWILSTGGEAARAGKPVQDTEVFPTPDGTHAYKIVALPLSDHQTHVDHVLCHLSRS